MLRARAAEVADFLEFNSWKYIWSTAMCRFSRVEKGDVFSSDNATVVEDKYFFLNYVYVEKR